MASGTGYDLSTTTFSPDGRLHQVEYASKCVDLAGTAVVLRCKEGVVFAVEKLILFKMLEPNSQRRIHAVDTHAGLAFTGLPADGRQIVKKAKSEARNYKSSYGMTIPGNVLNKRVSNYMQLYTMYSSVRAFGCAALLGCVDSKGPHVYHIEPSGVSFSFYGAAIGKGKQSAKTELEKLDLAEMSMVDAVKEAARIIHAVHDDVKDKPFELELSWIGPESNFEYERVPAELHREAEQYALEATEE